MYKRQLWRLAALNTPQTKNAKYTQAIMDIGATVCTPKNPNCSVCPISRNCEAFLNEEQSLFPNKRQKKALKPVKSLAFLVYTNEKNEVFLKKRPNQGIWGGLWSFEECQDIEGSISKTIKKHNNNASVIRRLKAFRHGFTHYNLWISPILVDSPGGHENYFHKDTHLKGLPAPVKKILQAL